MSYILDALKRAEIERERGLAPHLHTRHDLSANAQAGDPSPHRFWPIVASALVLGSILACAWLFWPTADSPIQPTPAALAVAVAPPPTPQIEIPAPPKPSVIPSPAPAPAPAPTTAPASVSVPVKPNPVVTEMVVTAKLSDLPETIRSQIPKLNITGSVYSETPSQRLLLVNNLVLTPGSLVAPELTLEEIESRHSVFSFRGTRFQVSH
jgi:general secretion pathway protein B